jgi:hypothetical protein
MARVLSPVNQLHPEAKPMASWQLAVAEAKVTPQPMATLLDPVVRLHPANAPMPTLLEPVADPITLEPSAVFN